VGDDGVAACRLSVETPQLDECPAARGWADPAAGETFTERDGVAHRLCDVKQLTGAPLQACRTTLECADCGSGWCATELTELLADNCGTGTVPWPIRYVGGASAGAVGWFTLVCELE
jgi:hypothetical protein